MKILHTVESYYPSVGGMQEVVKQLSERLALLGHEVVVATKFDNNRKKKVINGVKVESFFIGGNMVKGYVGDSEEIVRYENFLLNEDFDIVVNFAAQQWATDLALPILEKIKAKKIFVPTGFSALNDEKYINYFESLKNWMKKYDLNIFLSNDYQDINFAMNNGIEKNIVIPNGASAEEFLNESEINIRNILGIDSEQLLILLVGSHTGLKGHAEAIKIFNQAEISQPVTLLIIGNFHGGVGRGKICQIRCRLSELLSVVNNKKRIITRSLSRAETVAAYKSADLFLFPSNIECSPIVLFEAMAAKLPFLVTDVGNSREIIDWSNGGELLPTYFKNGRSYADIKESLEIFEKLIDDKEKRKKMGEKGFIFWQENVTWDKIAKKYEDEYNKLLKQNDNI